MATGILHGVLAGAAGTTALNTVTYLDMAIRGRPSSDSPQQLVETAAEKAGTSVPGTGDTRENRLQGLGPLSGTLSGLAVGVAAGIVHRLLARTGRSVPAPVAVPVIAATAMALSDVPLKLYGVSDPSSWAARDWVSDAVPHLAYGLVTYASLHAVDPV